MKRGADNEESRKGDSSEVDGEARVLPTMVGNLFVAFVFLIAALVSHAVSGFDYGCPVIWMPAGIAFAALLEPGRRCWPGVVAGSLLASGLVVHGYGLAIGRGVFWLGITGELVAELGGAMLGASLVRRRVRWPQNPVSEGEGLKFYLYGGLVGGLAGGVANALVWMGIGMVPAGAGGFFLVQRCLGHVLGIVAVAPLALAVAFGGRMVEVEDRGWRARMLPSLVALGAALGLLAYVSRAVIRERRTDFQEIGTREAAELNRLLAANLETLESVRSLWDSSETVTEEEFRKFVSRPLERNSGMEWLGWLPEIEPGGRDRWNAWAASAEAEAEAPALPEPTETEIGAAYPVLYSESRDMSRGNRGVDLGAMEGVAEFLADARGSPQPRATPLFELLGHPRLAIFLWIDRNRVSDPVEDGADDLSDWLHRRPGFAVAILDVQWLLQKSEEGSGAIPLGLRLVEPLGGEGLSAPWKESAEVEWGERDSGVFPREEALNEIEVGSRRWYLQARPRLPLLVERPPWEIAGAQVTSNVLVMLLGLLIMAAAGRNSRIRREVEARTAELTEVQERFAQLADNVNEGFWITEAGGERVLFLSRGVGRIWGRPIGEIEARPELWRGSIHPEDREAAFEAFRHPDSESGFDIEYRIVRVDGAIRWIRDRGFPVRNEVGEVIRIAGVADDTTEQKANEEKLLRAMKEAREAGTLLEQLFKVSLDMLCMAGTDGFFKRINPAFHDTLGYSDEELLSRPFVEFVHPDDVEQTVEAVRQLADGELLIRFQNRYRHRSGRYLWLEWSAVPDPDENLIFAAARNVTVQKEMELELQRSNAELEQFAYLASHDLQEPLRVVTSFVQLLQKRYRGRLDENADEFIRHAVDGAERMRKLIHGLLELSRVERKGRPLEVTESWEIVDEALKNLGVAIEESSAEIEIGALPRVMADREQLVRLFQNLIGNAIKFCREGAPRIRISARDRDGYEEFAVEDNGPGIAKGQRERVFQMFQRLESGTRVPGTGIGLAICRRIVERHGGSIWIEEAKGGGAAFRFRLPKPG